MKICRLTNAGLDRFRDELIAIGDGTQRGLSRELLLPGQWAEAISTADFSPGVYQNRFTLASDLDDLFNRAGLRDFANDAGLWCWLTVLLFDQVCPAPVGQESRKVGALARYYPEFGEWRRYYRHLLAGPWMIFHAHADDPRRAMALLAGPLHAPGDIVEQLASRQELVTNPTVMETVRQLYFDGSTGKLKRGTARKTNGGPRRLVDILSQFDVTYDLYSVTSADLLALLPSEFDDFRSG